jgi:hypothetical protein
MLSPKDRRRHAPATCRDIGARLSRSQARARVVGAVLIHASALGCRQLFQTPTVAIATTTNVYASLLNRLSGRETPRRKIGVARIRRLRAQQQQDARPKIRSISFNGRPKYRHRDRYKDQAPSHAISFPSKVALFQSCNAGIDMNQLHSPALPKGIETHLAKRPTSPRSKRLLGSLPKPSRAWAPSWRRNPELRT